MGNNVFMRYLPLLLLAILWEVAPRLHLVDPSELPPLSAVAGAAVAWLAAGPMVGVVDTGAVCCLFHMIQLASTPRATM